MKTRQVVIVTSGKNDIAAVHLNARVIQAEIFGFMTIGDLNTVQILNLINGSAMFHYSFFILGCMCPS